MLKVYINSGEISQRVKELACEIENDIRDEKDLIFVANLKGSIMFFSDVLRFINRNDIMIDFVATESYKGKESTGEIRIVKDISLDVFGKGVFLFEDIVDTGLTLFNLLKYIKEIHRPKFLKTVVLLDKPSRRVVDLKPDYKGFVIENFFVVGYGMDFDEKYRNLPYIAILE